MHECLASSVINEEELKSTRTSDWMVSGACQRDWMNVDTVQTWCIIVLEYSNYKPWYNAKLNHSIDSSLLLQVYKLCLRDLWNTKSTVLGFVSMYVNLHKPRKLISLLYKPIVPCSRSLRVVAWMTKNVLCPLLIVLTRLVVTRDAFDMSAVKRISWLSLEMWNPGSLSTSVCSRQGQVMFHAYSVNCWFYLKQTQVARVRQWFPCYHHAFLLLEQLTCDDLVRGVHIMCPCWFCNYYWYLCQLGPSFPFNEFWQKKRRG